VCGIETSRVTVLSAARPCFVTGWWQDSARTKTHCDRHSEETVVTRELVSRCWQILKESGKENSGGTRGRRWLGVFESTVSVYGVQESKRLSFSTKSCVCRRQSCRRHYPATHYRPSPPLPITLHQLPGTRSHGMGLLRNKNHTATAGVPGVPTALPRVLEVAVEVAVARVWMQAQEWALG
jgi:hypothetical protein